MSNNNLVNKDINNLSFKNIRVLNVYRIEDYYVLTLENNQKIVTNGYKIYDISGYKALYNIFEINDKLCAVLNKASKTYVVDLKTMDILLEYGLVSTAYKLDDKVIEVIMKINAGEKRLYNNETKEFLPSSANYEFDYLIGEHQYIFREKDPDKSVSECKRCIMNADGEIVLDNIEGYIYLCDNNFIISKDDELDIVKKDKNDDLQFIALKKNDTILAKPELYKNQIYILEKGLIKVLNSNLELVTQYEIKDMDNVLNFEVSNNIVNLCLSNTVNNKEVERNLFLNMNNGKSISHDCIFRHPYWTPNTYIGVDNLDVEQDGKECRIFNFYDTELNKKLSIKGNDYYEIDGSIFMVKTYEDDKYKEYFVNAESSIIKECNYDSIEFLSNSLYGNGFNKKTDMLDLVDRDLNVIIANIDYKALDLGRNNSIYGNIRFYVVNNYVCIKKQVCHYEDTYVRNIIIDSNGEIVLDSMEHTCTPMGFYIQITKDGESEYLNTLTGEKGELSINVFVKNNGSIDLDGIKYVKNIFHHLCIC